jgi:hypothetical protein
MRILGIDPGQTTGWCLYDAEARRVVECGHGAGVEVLQKFHGRMDLCDAVVLERPKGYGPTYPQVVDAAYVCGYLAAVLSDDGGKAPHELVRRDVCTILTDATHGVIRVKNDTTAWAALVLLHGEGSDRKPKRKNGVVVEPGGPLGEVKSHARAALAVAVAWHLREALQPEAGRAGA